MTQIAFAIKFFYNDIVHGNLKPENIYLDEGNKIKIGGFIQFTHTQSKALHYGAPEMFADKGMRNELDVWSMGVILYEIITLKLPFEGQTFLAIKNKVLGGTYNEKLLDGRCDPEIVELVKSLLIGDSDMRTDIFVVNDKLIAFNKAAAPQPPPKKQEERKEIKQAAPRKEVVKPPVKQPTAKKEEIKTEKLPGDLRYAAKLEDGGILIFDTELNIVNIIKSSLWTSKTYHSDLICNKNVLISCGEKGIEYWGEHTGTVNEIGCIYSMAFLPNEFVAVGGGNDTIYIVDNIGKLVEKFKPHGAGAICSLLWVEESGELWIGDWAGHIYIGKELETATHSNNFQNVEIREHRQTVHPQAYPIWVLEDRKATMNIFSAGGLGRIGVWTYDGQMIFKISPGGPSITSLSLFGDSDVLIGDAKGNISLWTATIYLQKQIATFKPHQAEIWGRGIHRIGNTNIFISAGQDKVIKLIDPKKKNVIKELTTEAEIKGIVKMERDAKIEKDAKMPEVKEEMKEERKDEILVPNEWLDNSPLNRAEKNYGKNK